MIEVSICGALGVVALIHLLPVIGVLGRARLEDLYAVPISGPNLEILMRHRAVLFGGLGVLLVWAIFDPALRSAALVCGLISVVSFLALALKVGHSNAALRRVVIADIIALIALAIAAPLHWIAS